MATEKPHQPIVEQNDSDCAGRGNSHGVQTDRFGSGCIRGRSDLWYSLDLYLSRYYVCQVQQEAQQGVVGGRFGGCIGCHYEYHWNHFVSSRSSLRNELNLHLDSMLCRKSDTKEKI